MLYLLACFPSSTTVDSIDHGGEDSTGVIYDTGMTTLIQDDAYVRALTGLPQGEDPVADPQLVRVIDTSDGDTIWVEPDGGGEYFKVRLIGIDTPEIAHDDPAECYGDEAWAYTTSLIKGRLVWLTFDGELYDDYDRTLAYVIHDTNEAGFINRNIARNGYALQLSIYPNTSFEDEIGDDVDAARSEDLGLWSACK